MPTGIPARHQRATRSASTSSAAPSRTEAGSSSRWSGPIASRSRCGTTSPTKPIVPEMATAAEVARVASMVSRSFSRSTSMPRLAAWRVTEQQQVERPPAGEQER